MSRILHVIAGFFSLLGFKTDEWFTDYQAQPENVRAALAGAEAQDFQTASQAERYAAQMGQAVDGMSASLVTLQSQAKAATANADKNMKLAAQWKGKDPTKEQFYFSESVMWQKRATQYQGQVDAYATQLAQRTQNLAQAKTIALSFYSKALRSQSDDEFIVADAVMNALDKQFNDQLRGQLGLRRGQQGSDVRGKLQAHIKSQAAYNKHAADMLTQMAQMAGMAQYAGADEGMTDVDQTAIADLQKKYGYTPSTEEAPAADAKSASAGS